MTTLTRRSALAAAAAAGLARPARAASPIRIGVLTDMSGPYADSGGPGSVEAARMAAAEVGAVLGQPVEIVSGDTQNKPDVAGGIARQWAESGMDAIVDLPVTPVAAAVQTVCREKGISVLITAAAASEFTSKTCSIGSTHWADDTHALAASATAPIVQAGGKRWFFITVDFSFGLALQREATAVIERNGGTVIGTARFPIGTTDFASLLVQAQSAGADVIGLAAVGGELVNLVKQASEFGLSRGGKPQLAGFLIYVTEVHALGAPVAAGFTFGSGFYWNANEVARAWSQRFFAARRAMPTREQAATFTATRHFLRAVQQTGSRDMATIGRAMRGLPVDYLGNPATIRADGRLLYDLGVYRVRSSPPAPWDYYERIGTVAAADAFLPMNPSCA